VHRIVLQDGGEGDAAMRAYCDAYRLRSGHFLALAIGNGRQAGGGIPVGRRRKPLC
jgi:hypothetical protein